MATVEVLTKARMEAIEAEAIVDARIDSDGDARNLILIRNNGVEINAGDVRGPIGITPTLPPIPDELDWNADGRMYGASPAGGAGVPTLKLQAGTVSITTNDVGRAAIYFPELFNGVSAVVANIGLYEPGIDAAFYTHINGSPIGGTAGVSVVGLNVITEGVVGNAFHVTIGMGSTGGFGVPNPGSIIGGCGPLRINWMAFGW